MAKPVLEEQETDPPQVRPTEVAQSKKALRALM